MTPMRIINAHAEGRLDDVAQLVFEYMAMTEGEKDRPVPTSIDELPAVLSAECRALSQTYAAPGVVLLACVGEVPVGCVGLRYLDRLDRLELKRLFVRTVHRGQGTGRALMLAAHAHAARVHVSRIVLDVMPSRTQVTDFYRRLGYRPTSPYQELAYPMVVMARAVRPEDEAYPPPRTPHR